MPAISYAVHHDARRSKKSVGAVDSLSSHPARLLSAECASPLLVSRLFVWQQTRHSELFHSLSGSYGSLAILLSAEIECEPASPTVVVTCTRHATVEAGLESLRRKCRFQDPANPGQSAHPNHESISRFP